MKEKELKIDDIAQLTGLSVEGVRHLVREYDDLFSYRTLGRVKLFSQRAVKTVQNLKELAGKGLAPDEVRNEVRAGKIPQPPAGGAEESDGTDALGRSSSPPEIVIEFRTMQDALAHQHRQIARLTDDLAQERAVERGRYRRTAPSDRAGWPTASTGRNRNSGLSPSGWSTSRPGSMQPTLF